MVPITCTERDGRTLVRIEQSGWDRLGEAGPPRRDKTGQAWTAIGEQFRRACE